jgi:AraC-like DNA-binding protein
MMTIRFVWLFLELAPRSKHAALTEQLRARFGLTPEQFRNPDTRVPLQLAVELLDAAVVRSAAPHLGMLAAERATREHMEIVEFMARSKRTVAEAIGCIAQYVRLLSDGVHLQVEQASVRIWFDSNLVLPNAVYELVVATLLLSLRRITGRPELTPVEVHLMGPAPHDASRYLRLFKCGMSFNMPVTQLVLDAQLLDAPLPNPEPMLSRILERYARAVMNSLPRNEDLVTMVRDMLASETELRDTSAKRLARRLGVSVRTLARRLGDSGTSYRGILDETRRHIALRDLAHTLRPIDNIALQLGFASSQSFHRAFRRWTGDTATRYRERSRRDTSLH